MQFADVACALKTQTAIKPNQQDIKKSGSLRAARFFFGAVRTIENAASGHDPSCENSVWSTPQSATNAKYLNNFSAENAQSKAEGILNRCAAQNHTNRKATRAASDGF